MIAVLTVEPCIEQLNRCRGLKDKVVRMVYAVIKEQSKLHYLQSLHLLYKVWLMVAMLIVLNFTQWYGDIMLLLLSVTIVPPDQMVQSNQSGPIQHLPQFTKSTVCIWINGLVSMVTHAAICTASHLSRYPLPDSDLYHIHSLSYHLLDTWLLWLRITTLNIYKDPHVLTSYSVWILTTITYSLPIRLDKPNAVRGQRMSWTQRLDFVLTSVCILCHSGEVYLYPTSCLVWLTWPRLW
jgi:hypothetical protein